MVDVNGPRQVPAEEMQAEQGIVRCLMVLLNKATGLQTLEGSANLWPVLAVRYFAFWLLFGCFLVAFGYFWLLLVAFACFACFACLQFLFYF